jgi:hypothetical protein
MQQFPTLSISTIRETDPQQTADRNIQADKPQCVFWRTGRRTEGILVGLATIGGVIVGVLQLYGPFDALLDGR